MNRKQQQQTNRLFISFIGRAVLFAHLLLLAIGLDAQTTVTINCTGTANPNSGYVGDAGSTVYGTIQFDGSPIQRGFARFDLSSIPSNATITAATIEVTVSGAAGSTSGDIITLFTGNTGSMTRAQIYSAIGSGTAYSNTSWSGGTGVQTKPLSAAGVAVVQANIGGVINAGFRRSGNFHYYMYGSTGTSTQQPKLILTYTVPTPCSGTPSAGTSSISPSSGVAGTAFNVSNTGASGDNGNSYQWQYSYDGGTTWTNWSGQTSTSFSSSTQSTIHFRMVTTCSNSGLTATSNTVSYTVTSWNMPSTGTVTAYACSGTFYDSGGSGSNYGDGQNGIITFYPATAGQKVQVTFTSFATESSSCSQNYDWLRVYDGNSTAATALHPACGSNPGFRNSGAPMTVPQTFTSTASDGSLTFNFRSDGNTNAAGWVATISCYNPCTTPTTYTVTGGGARCTSGAGLAVGLSGSQSGLSYQLLLNGSPNGSPVAGTGSAISFGTKTAAGNYTVEASASGYCTTTFPSSVDITVDPVSVLGTLNNAGPISTCDHLGNISQVTLSGYTGTPSWEYGDAGGNWYPWLTGANAGTCCFYPNPGADRMRVRVQSGVCAATSYSSTILVQNRNAPAPTGVTSTATTYCLAAKPTNITLTATFPSSGDILPSVGGYTTVQFFSGSCGGTSVGAGTISGNTATLTITAPSTTTTYFARSTSSCETSTCAQVTVTVNDVPAQPSTVSGLSAPCSGSSQAYSVTNVAGVSYAWAFPGSGWNITGGSGTSSITVTVGSGTGNITVTPSNGCGNGPTRTFAVATGAGPTVGVSPSSASACGGVGVVLTASGASSYSWSPSTGLSATTGTSVTANPSSNTTYTVTETSSGCNNSTTVVVKVGPTVNATANASVSAVCPGGAVNLTSNGAEGTATLVDPTGDGGFEDGTTFAANGWTAVNAASYNYWIIGNAAPAYAGSRGAHITNNGSAYSYNANSADRTSHLYKDIVVPSGATNINLSFYWKSQGESGWDRLLVYTAPTSVTPVANNPLSNSTTLTGATLVWTQPSLTSSYALASVSLPNGLAGTTVRLIFTWQNDDNTGSQGPAAIDNVSMTYTPPAATYSYAWSSSPAGFTSSAQNPTANPTVATTYTVTVTNTATGCSDVASTSQVTMYPVPQGSLTAGGTVCAGELASLTFTATSGNGPFSITYNPSSQTTTGVISGSPFSSQNGTSAGTNTYTLLSVTSANGCTRTSGFTGASASVTGTSAPTAPTAPTSSYNCSTGGVTLTTSGAGAGEGYRWYDVASGGSAVATGASYSITPTHSTNYYVAKYFTSGGACESPRMGITAFADGLDAYTVTRNTGITFTDISGSGSVPTWRNGTSEDNLSQNLNIGFSFPFDGAVYTQFRMSTDGYITFNTATSATGSSVRSCGDAENYSNDNTTFSLFGKLGTVQSLAPFYDDLMPNGFAFASSFHYRTDASPNRLTVQWRGMSKYVDTDNCSGTCDYGNYNFQVILYETGNIEFVYGTMTATSDEDSKNYTCGLNSATISSTLNTAKLFTQQSANSTSFSSNPVNNLSTVPTSNSRLTFTRNTPIAPTVAPSCIVYNFPANGATNQCTNSILSWSPVNGMPTGYDVYFGTNNPPTNIINGTTQANTYLAPTLASNTTYYWRIVPRNSYGAPSASSMPVWSFSTGTPNSVTSISSSAGTNICVGTTTTLTVNGSLAEGSVYNWTTPVYFFGFEIASCEEGIPYPLLDHIFNPYACEASSRTITFTSAGTYRFDVYAKGCNGTTSCQRITIVVNDEANTQPTAITSSAGTTLCSGTNTTLTATGGSQGAGASYQWYTGSCGGTLIATTSSNTVSVAPTVGTTYFVRLTGGNTCPNTTSCASLAVTVQNAIGNNTISAAQSICSGTSPATLTGSTPTGGSGSYTYSWESSTTSATTGFGAIGSSNSINYSPGTLTQTTWFRRTVTSGSCTTPNVSTAIQVTINPSVGTPTAITIAAGSEPSCQLTNGTTTTTYATTASNNTGFNWSLSNPAAGSINSSGVMTWANGFSGSVNIQVTANGCGGPSSMVTRTVNITPSVGTPSFTAGATTLCSGATETYTATVTNGTITYSVTGGASINPSTGQVSSVTSNFTVTATAAGCNGPTTATRSVTVTGGTTPAVVVSANPGTSICAGTSVTFTATPTNGGSAPTYQWKLNGSNVGSGGTTYTNASLANGDVVSVEMTSNATCLSTPTATDSETMTLAQPNLTAINGSVSTPMATGDYLWAGNTNNSWTTASNWYVLNSNGTFGIATSLPTTSTHVFVVSHTVASQCVSNTASPTITATANSNNVTIGTGATVTVSGSNNLNVAGNWVSQGTFAPATGTVTFTGSGNRTIASHGNLFYNLVVNKPSGKVTITDSFEATEDLTVTNGTFEAAPSITGKAKRVNTAAGTEVRILNNGQLRVND